MRKDGIPESEYIAACAEMEEWAKKYHRPTWRKSKEAAVHGFFVGYLWVKREEERRIAQEEPCRSEAS